MIKSVASHQYNTTTSMSSRSQYIPPLFPPAMPIIPHHPPSRPSHPRDPNLKGLAAKKSKKDIAKIGTNTNTPRSKLFSDLQKFYNRSKTTTVSCISSALLATPVIPEDVSPHESLMELGDTGVMVTSVTGTICIPSNTGTNRPINNDSTLMTIPSRSQ